MCAKLPKSAQYTAVLIPISEYNAIHDIIMIQQVCECLVHWPFGLAHEMWRTAWPRNPGLVSSSITGNVMLLAFTWEGNLSSVRSITKKITILINDNYMVTMVTMATMVTMVTMITMVTMVIMVTMVTMVICGCLLKRMTPAIHRNSRSTANITAPMLA